MLVTVTLDLVYRLIVGAKPLPVSHRPLCPYCGGELSCIGFIPAHDWPFTAYDTS
jgi:hypothetical protein